MKRILCGLAIIIWGWAGPTLAADGINFLVAAEAYVDSGQLRTTLTLSDTSSFSVRDALGAIDLTGLSAGIHILTVRFQNQDGNWSQGLKQSFYRPASLPQGNHNHIVAAETFFDADPGLGAATPVATPEDGVFDQSLENVRQSLPLTGLLFGVHKLSMRFRDANNIWSAPISQSFDISPETLNLNSGGRTIASADYNLNGGSFQPVPTQVAGTFGRVIAPVNFEVTPPNTSYYWSRVRFYDNLGRVSFSGTAPLLSTISVPTAVTNTATNITATSANLNAQVNDNGALTTIVFNLGTSINYGTTFYATPNTLNIGAGSTSVTANRTGLICNTTYHYRVAATNSLGMTNGVDRSFTTLGCGVATFTVTPTVGTGGSVSPNTAQTVGSGTTTHFTVTANSGYTKNSAVGGTCPQGSWNGNIWTTGMIIADCTVSFSFSHITSAFCWACLPNPGGWRSAIQVIKPRVLLKHPD